MRVFRVLGLSLAAACAAVWLIPRAAVSNTVVSITPAQPAPRAAVSISGASTQPQKTPLEGIGTSVEQFRPALPGYQFSFPRDHGSHPAYQTEWWYFTGHLKSSKGKRFSYQATWFRTALVPGTPERASKWATRDIIFAHLALTDEENNTFYYDDRVSRAALEMAGADAGEAEKLPRIWLDDWTLRFGGEQGEQQSLRAVGTSEATRFALELTHRAAKPPVIQGVNGISQKAAGAGRASHYYSYTRLETSGKVRINGEEYSVSGESWFDHEFGSNQIAPEQAGWDWFSLQLADGRELMLFQLRSQNGDVDPHSSGTLIERDGQSRHLKRAEFRIEPLATWRSPRSGGEYPARWKVTLPGEGIELQIAPTVADQELDTARSTGIIYWEGGVRLSGTQNGRPLAGQGYVELTGYADSKGKL